MKTFIIRIVTVITTAIVGFGLFCLWTSYHLNSASRSEILKLANDFQTASAKKDIVTLDRITTGDFKVIRVDGSVINKAECIAIIRNTDLIIDSIGMNNIHADIEEDQATITEGLEMLAHLDGRDSISHSSNVTYLFKKQHGRWQIACVRERSNFTQ